MQTVHRAFAVGRLAKNDCRVIVLEPVAAPIRGPWELRAVVGK